MRYTVQYIPLNRMKPGISAQITNRVRELRRVARDCMHLVIVRKSKKGNYTIVSGMQNYDFLKKHTKKTAAPCLVDENNAVFGLTAFVDRIRKRKLPYDVPYLKKERIPANSWSIIRTFLKQETRFKQLSRTQQLKVLRLGLQYKRTAVSCMKSKVDALLNQ